MKLCGLLEGESNVRRVKIKSMSFMALGLSAAGTLIPATTRTDLRKTILAFLSTLFLPVMAMALTYDPVADWNSSSNTTADTWQYGTETTLGGTFTLFPDNNAKTTAPTYDLWDLRNSVGINGPFIGFNSSGTTINAGGSPNLLWPSGVLQIAPGVTPDDTVLRWVAPSNGSIDITGDFTDLQASSVGLYIQADGSTIFSSSYDGSSHQAAVPFSLSNLSIAQGEDIDFIVGSGGADFNDSVGISATLAPSESGPGLASAVPLPSAAWSGLAMLAILAATRFVWSRRRLALDV